MNEGDEEVYRKHAGDLGRLATVLVGRADAHDVVADAVLKAFAAKAWASLDDDAKGGYLYRTVVNQARQHARSRTRRERREALFATRSTHAEPVGRDLDVWETVAGLSTRQRAVVFLTYWGDLDGRTVGKVLGISEGSVRRHLHHARQTLQRRLDG